MNVLSTSAWTGFITVLLFNNTIIDWSFALIAFALAYYASLGLKLLLSFELHRRHRLGNWGMFRYLLVLIDTTTILFHISWGLFAALLMLNMSTHLRHLLSFIPTIALLCQIGIWGKNILSYKLSIMVQSKASLEEKQQFQAFVVPFTFIGQSLLWVTLSLIALSYVGVNISAVLAGLGIGGIAVALAVQSTLTDLLAALTIAFDKPFTVGDFIIAGDFMGSVEKIGLKTTRLRSLSGEELVCPNHDLLGSRLRNYKRMQERRIVFTFSIIQQDCC